MTDEIITTDKPKKRTPKVRLVKPAGRLIQLRYTDPETKKEIRISTGTTDDAEALEEKSKLEAKLLLGIDAKPRRRMGGPSMAWEDFRLRYSELQLSTLREKTIDAAESRLDIAERILKPRTLGDVANSEALHDLQSRLRAGDEGKGPRAAYTVRNYMAAVVASLNWASAMGWLPAVPKVRKVKVARLRQMKGRPITTKEFRAMLGAVEATVGVEAAPSWKYLLRALWESALRLDEAMHLHWSDPRYIVPKWTNGELPILAIPAAMQKNDTEESIPLLPGFEALLLETPKVQRFGWVINPMSLQTMLGRRVRNQRADAEWIGKVITRIGKAAGVAVRPADGDSDEKWASAHDLRRSCAARLVAADIPEREVARVLRHASIETTRKHYAPGTVQESANIIRKRLSVPRYNQLAEST
jgi:integrase